MYPACDGQESPLASMDIRARLVSSFSRLSISQWPKQTVGVPV
jgi:hypothetical protein